MSNSSRRWFSVLVASPVIGLPGMLMGFPLVMLLCVPVSIVAYIGLKASRP